MAKGKADAKGKAPVTSKAQAGGTGELPMVEYPRNGAKRSAFLARPGGAGPHPAVIVVQEWWGLNDHIKDVARRLAAEGYVALAPDLYQGQVTADPNVAGKLMSGLSKDEGVKDLLAAVEYLKGQPFVKRDRLGVIGFCMGGSYALLLACRSKDIRATAPFYGEVPDEKTLANLSCPVLYIYGDQDFWITPLDVKRLQDGLKKFKKSGEVKIYGGAPHAFFNDTRKDVYRPKEAQDAWKRALDIFATQLK